MKTAPRLLGLLLATFFSCSAFAQQGDQPTDGASESAALSVEATVPRKELWAETVAANGWLAAWQEAIVSAEIGGQRITAVNAEVGDKVNRGDILVELSRDSLESDLRQREAAVESAKADLDEAIGNGDRARSLQGSGAATEQQITEYLVAERKAKADLASNEAALEAVKLNLAQTRIRAVDDGIISSRSASLGGVVSSGEELFRLIRQGRVEWQAEIPLRQLVKIKNGTEVVIPTPFGDVKGKVRQIGPTASEKTGRVTAYVSIEKPEGDLPSPKTGIFISGYFLTGTSEALIVPSTAVTLRDGFSYVYVINEGDPTTVTRKRVETARHQRDWVEITSGLDGDERIAKSGGAFLSDGSVVRLVDAAGDDNRDSSAGLSNLQSPDAGDRSK